MKIRILDRILVSLAGLILILLCGLIIAQLFFQVDVAGFAVRVVTRDSAGRRAGLTAGAIGLLLLGCYCISVMFRHRKQRERFVLQKNDNGELAISIKALDSMVEKCLEQHAELDVQSVKLENLRDGLLIRIRGNVAGNVSIPLTVEALQRQIKQYVTAISGVEVKAIRVQIEASGDDVEEAPFTIAAPTAVPLLREAEKAAEMQMGSQSAAAAEGSEPPKESAEPEASAAQEASAAEPEIPPEDDDRPIHQRIFSAKQEPCIVPVPPEDAENSGTSAPTEETPEATAEGDAESGAQAAAPLKTSFLQDDGENRDPDTENDHENAASQLTEQEREQQTPGKDE